MKDESQTIEKQILCARKDRETLGRLLERYRAYFLIVGQRQINRRVAPRVDPADIVQQTFAEAVEAFHQFTGSTEPEFTSWLQSIHEHNLDDVARKHVLAKRRAVTNEERLYHSDGSASFFWKEPAADQSTPSQRVIKGEKALRLAEILQSLPEAQRDAVRMRHIEGQPLEEIAADLDRSVVAAAGLIKRGLEALRSKMSEESWMT